MEKLLTQAEAAQILCLSPRTLERHRLTGTGPQFTRLGRLIRYRPSDIAAFVDANLRLSTSDNSPGTAPVQSC